MSVDKEVKIGDLTFALWCDGRGYDPVTESYRPVYSYSITSEYWRYDGNDIQGPPNTAPDIGVAFAALLALFLTCVDADEDDERSQMFPPHVRESGLEIFNELVDFCKTYDTIE